MEAINLKELPLSLGASNEHNSYTTVIQLLVSQNRSYYFCSSPVQLTFYTPTSVQTSLAA